MPDLDLSAFRKVAETATPGEWHAVPEAGDLVAVESGGMVATITMWSDADANHIATFDPPTVLALLDELERLRQEAQGPKFSDRLLLAQRAWESYRTVAKLADEESPTLFTAGYTMGISAGYQRTKVSDG